MFIVEKDFTVKFADKNSEFFYHPSISKIRYNNYESSENDYLIKTIDATPEATVLDLTMGLGSEALFMANYVKKVTGVEASFPLYLVVKEGLNNYNFKQEWMKKASKKINIINDNYKNILKNIENNFYDIVYCDPMFENPQMKSSPLNSIRQLAVYDKISQEDFEHMIRIAKKRVVIKAREKDSLWDKFTFDEKDGSKNSGVYFGVIKIK
jgi:tRNA1(Val) A37 N6-methylase TrmN6